MNARYARVPDISPDIRYPIWKNPIWYDPDIRYLEPCLIPLQENGTSHSGLPLLQATTSKKLHKKKKAMMATWDDSETKSDEEEIDIANVCFMGQRERNQLR